MTKAEFNNEIKNIDFDKFAKEDKAFSDDVKELEKAVNEPEAEIDAESASIITALFDGVKKHWSHIMKGAKAAVKKAGNSFKDAIDGLKIMLDMAGSDNEKKSYNDAIDGLEVMADLS